MGGHTDLEQGGRRRLREMLFGLVEEAGGKLQPVIKMTVPAELATPVPDGSCKL